MGVLLMIVECNCEICGKHLRRSYPQERVPNHFFCSRECQNEWQKTREDLVLRNKDPDFRKKVSQGLKRRKQELKDNYHSPEINVIKLRRDKNRIPCS